MAELPLDGGDVAGLFDGLLSACVLTSTQLNITRPALPFPPAKTLAFSGGIRYTT